MLCGPHHEAQRTAVQTPLPHAARVGNHHTPRRYAGVGILRTAKVYSMPSYIMYTSCTCMVEHSLFFFSDSAIVVTDADAAARRCALCLVVSSLTERLRAVFVPYFRYLVDDMCTDLGTDLGKDGTLRSTEAPAVQRQKRAPKRNTNAGPALAPWLLRLRIVRALHRCFLYDGGKFMDEARVLRLLPLLINQVRHTVVVGTNAYHFTCRIHTDACYASCITPTCIPPSQMATPPPALLLDALTASDVDADLDATLLLGEHSTGMADVTGRAAVGALVQAAVGGGSDALWKPINTQALMQTRSPVARTRLLGLEVTAQLVTRLREEFLVLLPESLPFLAEVLEDVEVAVEARAKEVVTQLEELSGESLQQYLTM